ncbi:MAG: hypothetical protein WC823_00275 [Parcubacteria group bacterium]|jgi:hypothetical protein
MYHRFGHAQAHFVKLGDKVKKGQKILTVGTGNGQWSAHCHYDCPQRKLNSWTSYVFGWTSSEVKGSYADPTKNIKTVMPGYDHMGYGYLQSANYGTLKAPKWCYHPGVDLNGKGAGNADLGAPIYSPCDGVVVYDFDDGKALDGGWGRLLVIEETVAKVIETTAKVKTEQAPQITIAPNVDEIVAIPVRVEQPAAKVDVIEQQVEEIRQAEEVQTETAPAENNILQIVFNLVGDLIIKIINIWKKR